MVGDEEIGAFVGDDEMVGEVVGPPSH